MITRDQIPADRRQTGLASGRIPPRVFVEADVVPYVKQSDLRYDPELDRAVAPRYLRIAGHE